MQKGFSLLEALIAMAVIAVACMGLVAAYSTSVSLSERVQAEALAERAISMEIADLRDMAASSFDDILVGKKVFAVDGIDVLDETSGSIVLHYEGTSLKPPEGLQEDLHAPFGVKELDLDPDHDKKLDLLPVEVAVAWGRIDDVEQVTRRFVILARGK